MKIIFAGTPDFAKVALQALIEAGHEIVAVLTQPDRPSGRGMKLTPSPVKLLAQEHQIPVFTPLTLREKKDPEGVPVLLQTLKDLNADVMIVAAYGLILPQPVLDLAKGIGVDSSLKAINIHGSLLPRWRGAAPVARAIEAGDAETGVVIMKMELGLDTGPMIREARLPIEPADTHDELMMKVAHLGAQCLVQCLETPDTLTATPQPEDGVTYAEKLQKTEGLVNWQDSASLIERKLRAFTPFPGLFFPYQDMTLKIGALHVVNRQGAPGTILDVSSEALVVACGEDAVAITVLQRPGKPKLPVDRVLPALSMTVGEVLA